MRGFLRRSTVDEALAWLDQHLAPLESETVPLAEGAARVLAADAVSPVDVPGFDRAMMDGFALRASDTFGATPYNRLRLRIVGTALAGQGFAGAVQPGEAVQIMTGAPIPNGADAVLPAEAAQQQGESVDATDEVSPGKHVGRRGEDVRAGDVVLSAGRILRPQDLGVLSLIGMPQVRVVRCPRVRVVVTGNELLPAGSPAQGFRLADANGPMLAALVARDGGVAACELVPDEPDRLLDALRAEGDVVIVSGGSSVGCEDFAPQLLSQHGELAVHGIAIRPSSPTGMGRLDGRLVFLLPGNPVSCLCAYDFFAGRAIRALGGRPKEWPHRRLSAPLARKLVSQIGRVDYARVRLVRGTEGPTVEPLSIGGASILTSTVRADGFVIVPADSEGYPAGAAVDVLLYD
ncbi:MAG: gephyrin-like molybdotransferase Glp [Pirellulales bacterium]